MIESDEELLMKQAPMVADHYLRRAVECIDHVLGEGYAKEHPELVSMFIFVCAQAYDSDAVKAVVHQRGEL